MTNQEKTSLDEKIVRGWQNRDDSSYIYVEDVRVHIQNVINKIDNAQEDYANLDWVSKEQAIDIIKEEFGKLAKEEQEK